MKRKPNHSMERIGASRSGHSQPVSRRRLAPPAHAGRWAHMSAKLIVPLISVLAVFSGCDREEARRRDLGRQTAALYEIYMHAGRDTARRSIVEANHLVEGVKLSNFEERRAFALFLGYGRLYALDQRAGSNDLAQLDLTKARYWALRSRELAGDAPGESAKYLEKFANGDRLLVFIDDWEKKANDGKEPSYVQRP